MDDVTQTVCPDHRVELVPSTTKYGTRFGCQVPDCTVVCWDGKTSTPATAETRALRHRCHEIFDPSWRDRTRFPSRNAAYRWLAKVMGLSRDDAHIGMFDREQCLRLIGILEGEK